MAKDTPYLDVQQLTKSFGSLVLFEDISFSIAEEAKLPEGKAAIAKA